MLTNVMLVLGLLLWIAGTLWILAAAWNEGCLWTLAVVFVPIGGLLFLLSHWQQAKGGFFLRVAGIATIVLAAVLSGPSFPTHVQATPPPPPGNLSADAVLGPRTPSIAHAAPRSEPVTSAGARQSADSYLTMVRADRWDEAWRYLPAPTRARVTSAQHAAFWRKQGRYSDSQVVSTAVAGSNAEVTISLGPKRMVLLASGAASSPSIEPKSLAAP